MRRPSRTRLRALVPAVLLLLVASGHQASASTPASPAVAAGGPDLTRAVAFLVDPSRLVGGHYYEGFVGSGFADYSLTLDGAFALAATGTAPVALGRLTGFIAAGGRDGAGRTIDAWTGIATPYASGGSIGKEALLAEVIGSDPHRFGGHDLVAALDAAVCTRISVAPDTSCPAAGSYRYSPSVFAQGLAIIAQLRAGASAAAPVAFLASLQHADGSWPSLIPDSGDSDVDSTAMAVMALDLVPGPASASEVARGLTWLAARQEADGGFPGAAGDSTNSAGLALQALSLDGTAYAAQLSRARAFLAARQNADGGFSVAAGGQQGSDVRASTQAVGGAVGTAFGVLTASGVSPSPSPTGTPSTTPTPTPTPTPTSSGPSIGTVSASASLSVGATSFGPDPSLPATGALLAPPAWVGLLLLAAGMVLVAVARRASALRRH